MFVGVARVSARLHAGGTDVRGDWREQLDQDAAPLLTGRQPVGLRAASADPCQDLVSSCRRKGWDDSVSVTDPRKKAPILRLAAAMGLREDEWEPLDAAGKERAIVVAYRPARGPEEPVYGVIRRDGDGEQRLLEPVYTVIPVSHNRLPLAELVRRHRGQQGQENAFKGAVDGLGAASSAVPLAHGASGLLPRRADRAAAAAAAVQQEQSAIGLAAARSEPDGAGLGRRGRSRAGPSGRGPTRSPRGDRCARSRGRSSCEAGAGHLRGGPGRSATG